MVFSASLSYRSLWTPASISTALWLDAADSGTLFDQTTGGSTPAADNAIARWADKSGNARHFTQSTTTSRPLRKVAQQNGLDSVQFDGSNDFLTNNAYSFLNSSGATGNIFVVCRQITGTSTRGLIGTRPISQPNGWSLRLNSTTEIFYYHTGYTGSLSRTVTDQVNIYEVERNGLSINLGSNGSFNTTATISGFTTASNGTTIGAENVGTNSYLNSSLCEIIVTESLLSVANREKVEGYLAHKWGLTANLPSDHPFKNSPSRGI